MRFLILFLILFPVVIFGQIQSKWTTIEIGEADVARSITGISDFEKDVILYHNLVRLYPIKYLEVEILNLNEDLETKDKIKFPNSWRGTDINSDYYKSLISTLSSQKPLPKLIFDYGLSSTAKCLAKEQSLNGNIGHNRINCPQIYLNTSNKNIGYGTGENCGYGNYNGKDLVNNLLIDQDVPSLGHRNNILNSKFTKIGAGTDFHPKYETVIVVDYLYEVHY
jgi:uncharacterized protein YkwD